MGSCWRWRLGLREGGHQTTPVYGDDVYGLVHWNGRLKKSHGDERQLLHAIMFEMDHPVSGERMVFRIGD